MDRPQCSRCHSYFMTWETDQPHGCRAFGFKSAALPSRVVEENSQKPCGLFERKSVTPTPRSRPRE